VCQQTLLSSLPAPCKVMLLSEGHAMYYGDALRATDWFSHLGFGLPYGTNLAGAPPALMTARLCAAAGPPSRPDLSHIKLAAIQWQSNLVPIWKAYPLTQTPRRPHPGLRDGRGGVRPIGAGCSGCHANAGARVRRALRPWCCCRWVCVPRALLHVGGPQTFSQGCFKGRVGQIGTRQAQATVFPVENDCMYGVYTVLV